MLYSIIILYFYQGRGLASILLKCNPLADVLLPLRSMKIEGYQMELNKLLYSSFRYIKNKPFG